jgi:hypothetical protein
VVALGYESDRDVDFLKALAARGNGRFYLTSNALNLPQIFTAETIKVTASSILEGAFLAEPVGQPEVLRGIDWMESPLLLGYNLVRAEPAAETLLISEKGDPLLVRWPFGLGSVTALATDIKPRWSAEWLEWQGYGQFWVQYLRKIARKADSQLIKVEVDEVPGQEDRLRVNLSLALPGRGFADDPRPQVLAVQTATGLSTTETAVQVAPGLYRAEVPRPERGTLVLTISAPRVLNQPVTRIYSRSYPEEYRMRETNRALLRQVAGISGGRFDPAPGTWFAPPGEITSRKLVDLTPYCLALALILLPGEIALRRFLGRL